MMCAEERWRRIRKRYVAQRASLKVKSARNTDFNYTKSIFAQKMALFPLAVGKKAN
jgi:hypothetical protein